MVALNKHFAPENPHTVEENRVGIFFGESTKSSRANPLSAQEPRLKKAYGYDETASGMFFYGFRYYDPETGRWPNRDPIQEQGGLNLYFQSLNDTINRIDYLGLCERGMKQNCAIKGVRITTQNLSDADQAAKDLVDAIGDLESFSAAASTLSGAVAKNAVEFGAGIGGLATNTAENAGNAFLESTNDYFSQLDNVAARENVYIFVDVAYEMCNEKCKWVKQTPIRARCEVSFDDGKNYGPWPNTQSVKSSDVEDCKQQAVNSLCGQ